MTDLSRLIDNLCAGLESPDTASLSGSPETLSGDEKKQPTDKFDNFRSFYSFRPEIGGSEKSIGLTSEKPISTGPESRVASSYGGEPERSERPENDGISPLAEASFLFPVEDREPERPETKSRLCEPPVLGPGPAALPPPGDPLPISEVEVRAGVARELRALAEDGREGPAALRDAVEITRAKIRNSEALAERQAHGGRCHVCDGPLDDSAPVVAVMTGKRGSHLHLHAGCCSAHSARMAALVDRIMVAAGYGADERTGEAA